MRRVGESVYYKEILKPELNETVGENSYKMEPIVGKRKLIIHTDRVNNELLAAVKATAEATMPEGATLVQYNHNMEISWRDINKYAECANREDMLAVNANYIQDLTSDGAWVYPLPNLTNAHFVFRDTSAIKKFEVDGVPHVLDLPKAWNLEDWFFANHGCPRLELNLPALAATKKLLNWTAVKILKIAIPKALKSIRDMIYNNHSLLEIYGDFSHVTDGTAAFDRNSVLKIVDSDWTSLSTAANFMSRCQVPKKLTLRVLNTIPSYTSGSHPLTLGIHIDHQNDDEVLAAIANAEAKGWTLTVQWNGTPTSTASTMAMGSLIYAKIGELEHPDGTTEQFLDWGHYVTNPEGYETFRSLESAYSYFGLEMPNIN